MEPVIVIVKIKWAGVENATGYEISKNGKKVATTGSAARQSNVSVGESTKIEVVDLPARSKVQEIQFTQKAG
jgi:hypothetical protein